MKNIDIFGGITTISSSFFGVWSAEKRVPECGLWTLITEDIGCLSVDGIRMWTQISICFSKVLAQKFAIIHESNVADGI